MKDKNLIKISRWVKLDKEGIPTTIVKEFFEMEVLGKKYKDNKSALIEYLDIFLMIKEGKRNPKKMKVVNYIISETYKNNSFTFIITVNELAEICEVAKQTSLHTLQFMESIGLINRRSGSLTLVPERAKELIEASKQIQIYLTK